MSEANGVRQRNRCVSRHRIGARVAKPGQRRQVEGLVSQEFVSSNLTPRTPVFQATQREKIPRSLHRHRPALPAAFKESLPLGRALLRPPDQRIDHPVSKRGVQPAVNQYTVNYHLNLHLSVVVAFNLREPHPQSG